MTWLRWICRQSWTVMLVVRPRTVVRRLLGATGDPTKRVPRWHTPHFKKMATTRMGKSRNVFKRGRQSRGKGEGG